MLENEIFNLNYKKGAYTIIEWLSNFVKGGKTYTCKNRGVARLGIHYGNLKDNFVVGQRETEWVIPQLVSMGKNEMLVRFYTTNNIRHKTKRSDFMCDGVAISEEEFLSAKGKSAPTKLFNVKLSNVLRIGA